MPKSENTLRILVVDDDRDAADSLGLLVQELGNQAHLTFGWTRLVSPRGPPLRPSNQVEDLFDDSMSMKTQGEIEAAICEGMIRFEQEYMGRGPKDIHTHVIGDLVIVRLRGVLTDAEQQLVKTLPAEKGRDLLKQVRAHLTETARPVMEAMIEKATCVQVVSLHHDISTTTGEEIVVFTLAAAPGFREAKK
jgi:uncharacterized protein YbcI